MPFLMIENLPDWIVTSAVPAGGVMVFFWKGDDALSGEFKQWLSQKILGVKLTVPDISSIEPFGRVLNIIYWDKYFSFTAFIRIIAIATATFVISISAFATAGSSLFLIE
jgi:hypothetical protein